MLKTNKEKCVAYLGDVYSEYDSVIIAHYHGLTVSDMTALRSDLRKNDGTLKVVKNTLSRIAIDKLDLEYDKTMFSGPTAIAYSQDPVSTAKIIVNFAKANNNLKIIGAFVNNKVLDASDVNQLSKLKTLNELRSDMVGLLKAPSTMIARILSSPASSLVSVMDAYSKK